jgi:hypothetical protein
MKTQLSIPIHSFVDIITNSSTEIFVTASERTITSIKELVDCILKGAGSSLRATDLYEFSLSKPYRYNEANEEGNARTKAVKSAKDNEGDNFNEEEFLKNWA